VILVTLRCAGGVSVLALDVVLLRFALLCACAGNVAANQQTVAHNPKCIAHLQARMGR
jgi:hypothetical protein